MSSFWNWLKSFFTSTNSGVILIAQGAGTAAGVLIVNNVDKNNRSGTAADVNSIGTAVLSLLTGSVPSQTQIADVMDDLKADAETANYAAIAQQFLAAFEEQLNSWAKQGYTDKAITAYAKAFINGMITGANLAAK